MSIDEFEARCRKTAEGMTFFGEPVQGLDADRLLVLVGHLYDENKRLKESVERTSHLFGNLVIREPSRCASK